MTSKRPLVPTHVYYSCLSEKFLVGWFSPWFFHSLTNSFTQSVIPSLLVQLTEFLQTRIL